MQVVAPHGPAADPDAGAGLVDRQGAAVAQVLYQAVQALLVEVGQTQVHQCHHLRLSHEGDLHLHEGLARHRNGTTSDLADVVDKGGIEGVVVGGVSHQLVRPAYTVASEGASFLMVSIITQSSFDKSHGLLMRSGEDV